MTRLTWDAPGERFFELGVDRGVLYAPSQPGVAWMGLTAVNESHSGGESRPYYIEGVKYLNLLTFEEFIATIEAFSSPAEFGPCDGTNQIHTGLFATQQPRKSFGFCYRTRVGNEIVGPELGYKIHIVYNALAVPAQKNMTTMGQNVDPTKLSWTITTRPPLVTGLKPTAHFVVDSRTADPEILSDLEDILYGTEAEPPAQPTPDDLIAMFAP